MCHSPAFPTQLIRMRELARLPEIGSAGVQYVEEQIATGLTCYGAFKVIQKLGQRIAEKRT